MRPRPVALRHASDRNSGEESACDLPWVGVSRAVSLACGSIAAKFPDLYVEPHFDLRSDAGGGEKQPLTGSDSFASMLVDRCDAVIELGYEGLAAAAGRRCRSAFEPARQAADPAGRLGGGHPWRTPKRPRASPDGTPVAPDQLARLPISNPRPAGGACQPGDGVLPADRRSNGCSPTGEDPGALPRLSAERSDFCYLLPRSLLSERFENLRIAIRPLGVPLTSALVARISGEHEAVSLLPGRPCAAICAATIRASATGRT